MIGIMGEYIGKILSELKARPVYFVAEHSLKTADDADRADKDRTGSAGAIGGRVARVGDEACLSNGQTGTASVAAPAPAPRKIWLCADDYGISPSVSGAIRDLIGARPHQCHLGHGGGAELPSLRSGRAQCPARARRARGDRSAPDLVGAVPAADRRICAARRRRVPPARHRCSCARCLRQLDRKALQAEIAAQIRMFGYEFGRAPDFIDGHQHVQIFPQVRDALFEVAQEMAPTAWIRQCGRPGGARGPARRSQGLRARRPEQALPRARGGDRRAHQSGLRRDLYVQRECRLRGAVSALPRAGFRTADWSCAIPAWSTPNCGGSTR